MKNFNNILTYYQNSDNFKYLHIYFDCPELREKLYFA